MEGSLQEYKKLRNTFKEVYEPDTGRTRLMRGDGTQNQLLISSSSFLLPGEIVERIVTKDEHKAINAIGIITENARLCSKILLVLATHHVFMPKSAS